MRYMVRRIRLHQSVAPKKILVFICLFLSTHTSLDVSFKDIKERQMFISGLLEKIHYYHSFLKRITFHSALPSVGLRAEVARRW